MSQLDNEWTANKTEAPLRESTVAIAISTTL